jgi:hypothetical protein
LHGVCIFFGKKYNMYLHRKLDNPELIDLLVIHTNRLTQIMIYGETYSGEYEICKRTIELVQGEIISRQSYLMKPAFINGKSDTSSSYHQRQ